MSCSAIFILDLKGKVIISRNYRGDLDMNVIDKFIPRLIDMEDEGMQTPIICNDDATFIFVKHNNVYVVAISRKNTNVVLVQAFLYKMIQVFCDYFKDVEEESIRDNFVIIYELLDEMMDFGYPQTTEARILREYITQEGHKLDSAPRPPMALTNAVSWRSEGIKYRKNEVFLDVVESANANSTVLQSEIVGSVKMRVYLSGMPELRLGLNEKIQFENSGRGKNKAVELEDVKFHQCVRLSRFENDRTISFIPPDGEFELMNYRLTTVVKPLIWIEAVVEKFSHSRVEFMIKAKSQFKRRSTANNVEITVPVPRDADSPKFRAAIGAARYVPENNAFVWSIKSFPGGKEYLMRAQFKLPSVIGEEMEGRRPIKINFEIPYFTTSGIQVRYLKIIEKSGYQALPWVRYITQNGDYQHVLMSSVNDWQSIAYLYLWPESERLKKALKENAESSVYTTPVIKSDELLKDEVAEAIQQIQNQPHKRTEHGFDKNAIKALIKEKRLKAALNVTTHILTHAGHGINSLANRKLFTFEVMEIWNCRFQLLMSLKMHKLAFEEMTGFGELDAPDFYFQWQPEFRKQNVNGTLVPFNLRLIHAELPKYSADAAKAYKRIATLENSIQMILTQNRLTAEQTAVWEKRQEVVELTKARLLYTLNDEQNLIGLYQKIASQTSDGNLKREVQKMLVKLASVYGNAKLLEKFCAEAQASGVDGETCKSLKAIFFGKYQEAIDCLTPKQTSTNSNANCNNNAVCLLYLGRVKESVDQLLSHPETTPVLPVILNLFTVAELTTNTLRTEFFMRFSQHFGDLLEPRALRITK